uniref:Essential protein Yae1 N-terminal domain-containing protein n=1 Tax=Xenopsylla cheopis TaxID=163159 RepID=A0A6M2DH30_XENCH
MSSDNDETDETLQMSARDRDTASNIAYKIGYREGAEFGKNLTFQEGFGKGFRDGFKAGFHLGKYQGLLTLLQSNQVNIPNKININPELHVDKPSRGCCRICSNESNETIPDILKEQEIKTCNHLVNLFNSYGELANIFDVHLGKTTAENIF